MIVNSFIVIPQFFSTLFFVGTNSTESQGKQLVAIGLILLTVVLFLAIMYICLFKTDALINVLHLDKNFTEEKFELNIHRSTVLSIAVLVVGGIVLIDSIPNLCRYIFTAVQQKSIGIIDNPDGKWIVFYAAKALIGLFMLAKSRFIVNFIDHQRR